MSEILDATPLATRFAQAARHIRAQVDCLSQLDAAVGDGDHGTTMARVCAAILAAAEAHATDHPPTLCGAVGWAVLCTDGGSTSPLLGSFFAGMEDGLAGWQGPLSSQAFHAAFAAGLASLRSQTPAQPGDKTMVDALVPAIAALEQAASTGQPPTAALAAAATAAANGAESTRPLRAALGRARNLGERTVGHVDPGATSVALFFAGFAQ